MVAICHKTKRRRRRRSVLDQHGGGMEAPRYGDGSSAVVIAIL